MATCGSLEYQSCMKKLLQLLTQNKNKKVKQGVTSLLLQVRAAARGSCQRKVEEQSHENWRWCLTCGGKSCQKCSLVQSSGGFFSQDASLTGSPLNWASDSATGNCQVMDVFTLRTNWQELCKYWSWGESPWSIIAIYFYIFIFLLHKSMSDSALGLKSSGIQAKIPTQPRKCTGQF